MKFERTQQHLKQDNTPSTWMYQYLSDLITTANSLSGSSVSVTSNEITSQSGTLYINTSGLVNFNGLRIDFTNSDEVGVLVANSEDYASFQPLTWLGHKAGELVATLRTTAPTGWIMAVDGTIGNESSGATVRAHQDCETLYAKLWNKYSQSQLSVSGGRGTAATNDFVAGKTIALPAIEGRVIACSGSGSSLTVRTDYELAGSNTHTISLQEIFPHSHTMARTNFTGGGWPVVEGDIKGTNQTYGYRKTTLSNEFELESAGAGTARSNIEQTLYINYMIKL